MLGTRPSVRKITQHSVVKKSMRIGNTKLDMHTERERERHTHTQTKNISMFIEECNSSKMTIITTTTTFTKGYNVTLYSDSLRTTALYAIYINSLI